MWPFTKPVPDTRPASSAAKAISASLQDEPERWKLHDRERDFMKHDSGIVISTEGFVIDPDLLDEPDANGELVAAAIDVWVSKIMRLPPTPPKAETPNNS